MELCELVQFLLWEASVLQRDYKNPILIGKFKVVFFFMVKPRKYIVCRRIKDDFYDEIVFNICIVYKKFRKQ